MGSIGAWGLAFGLPMGILLWTLGVGGAVYGGAGVGVISFGGPEFVYKIVARFLAPPLAFYCGLVLSLAVRPLLPNNVRFLLVAGLVTLVLIGNGRLIGRLAPAASPSNAMSPG